MGKRIDTIYFSENEKAENYNKEFSHAIISEEENEIVTEYISRWNSSYNKKERKQRDNS